MTFSKKTISAIVLIGLTCIAYADPPPFSGIVTRGEDTVAVTWVDAEAGLRVIVGADMDEFCAGNEYAGLIAYQDVNLPSGRVVSNSGAIMQTTVWDFLNFDCALFTTIDPVASGYARVRYVDNDLTGSVVNNTNSWTFMAQGKLEDPWGTPMILSAHITRQLGNDSGFKFNSQIVLH